LAWLYHCFCLSFRDVEERLAQRGVTVRYEAVRRALESMGIEIGSGRFLDFYEPWGNRVEIVGYDNIQYTKAPQVLRGMGPGHLKKTASAVQELTKKGVAPDPLPKP